MQAQSISLPGTSGRLAGWAIGDPASPPMLALHGWQDNADSFAMLAPLIEHRYIVALDHAGHGLSEHRPPGTIYHMTDYSADVAHGIRALGWDRFDLMGHSLGAGVSMLYAAAYPEQVRNMILIDGLGPVTGAPESAPERLRKSFDASLAGSEKSTGGKPARVYRNWAQLIAARCQASPIGEAAASLLVRRNAIETEEGIRLRSDRRLRHPSPLYLTEDLVLYLISRIQARGLVVLAEEGAVIKHSRTQARIDAFPDLSVVTLPGQHHLHMDTAAIVANEINQFLAA